MTRRRRCLLSCAQSGFINNGKQAQGEEEEEEEAAVLR